MVTPKLWIKTTMVQMVKFIRYPTRTEKQIIQIVVSKVLYCGRSVNPKLLVALGSIASEQAKVTTQTESAVYQFLDYCETHPNAKLRYHNRDMILRTHSNVSYLSEL